MTSSQQPQGGPHDVFRGRLFRIVNETVTDPDGRVRTFEIAERPPGVRILVHTDRAILLTREWRAENSEYDTRLPGGKVFDTLEDYLSRPRTPETLQAAAFAAAVRELKEETELEIPPGSLKLDHISACGATVRWDLYYFSCRIVVPTALSSVVVNEDETIRPQWLPFADAHRLAISGDVREDRSAAVLLRFLSAAR